MPPSPLSWPLKTCMIMPVHDNAEPASLTLLHQVELPALLEHFQWLWVTTDRTLASSGPAEASASGQCEVQFRLTGDGSLQDPRGFSFGTWWGSAQVDGSLASSEPTGASVLGHCGVQFRLMESGLLRTCWGFSFGTLWGSVESDGSLVSSRPARRWCC